MQLPSVHTFHHSSSFLVYRYQLVIEAYDSAYPDNQAITQATINVRRNLHAPVFNPADYVTRITDEHLAVGSLINITVQATDRDDPVCRMSSFWELSNVVLLMFFFENVYADLLNI